MNAPILASDLKTGRALRVFSTVGGGSIAVDHPLSLIRWEHLFITGDCEEGFRVSFGGPSPWDDTVWDRYGDAVEAVRQEIGNLQRLGSRWLEV